MEMFNQTEDVCFVNLTVEQTLSYLYTPFAKYFVLVIVPIISVFGVFANGSFLYVVYRNHNMRTVTNFYLVSLAIADSCLLVVGSIQYLWSFMHSTQLNFEGLFTFNSPSRCMIPNLMIYLCYFSSIFLITFVTAERYLAICHAMRYHISRKRAMISTFVAWTFALLLAAFQISYFDVRIICVNWPSENKYSQYSTEIPGCFFACEWCAQVVVYVDIIQYFLSVSVVTCMSWAMVRQLKRSLTRTSTIRSTESTNARSNLVRMLQINAFVFFICLTPFEIINLNGIASIYNTDFLNSHQRHYIKWIGRITMLINSAINPVIYGVVNPSYRKAFFKDCCCCCPDRKKHVKAEEYEFRTSRITSTVTCVD